MMALVVTLVALLLVAAESQATDTAVRANVKGFLSQYIEDLSASSSGADVSKTSRSNYIQLITSSLMRMKHGKGPDTLSHRDIPYEHGFVDGTSASHAADRPVMSMDHKHLPTTAHSSNFLPMLSTKDHKATNVVDRKTQKLEVEKMHTSQSPNTDTDTGLMAIGMTLLAFAMAFAVRCRKQWRAAPVLATCAAGHGPDMLLPASDDYTLELKSQVSRISGKDDRSGLFLNPSAVFFVPFIPDKGSSAKPLAYEEREKSVVARGAFEERSTAMVDEAKPPFRLEPRNRSLVTRKAMEQDVWDVSQFLARNFYDKELNWAQARHWEMEHWRRLEIGSLENVLIMTQDGSEIVGSITLDSWAIVSLIRAFSLSEEMSSLLEHDDEDVIALMSNLAVRKDMRGQGLARELLVAAEETASSVGYPEILFMVESSNLPALKLYKSSGYTSLFSKVSTVCEPGGEWGAQQAEVVFMRKRLLGS